MRERGILFKDRLVRAILDDRKSQTRRPVKADDGKSAIRLEATGPTVGGKPCPYGVVGDRLWVREAWRPAPIRPEDGVLFRADASNPAADKWKPGIHLRRVDARITLEVTNVNVEPLQSITEEEAMAEGVEFYPFGEDVILDPGRRPAGAPLEAKGYFIGAPPRQGGYHATCHFTAVEAFASLWDSIHGGTLYAWDNDPEVWAIKFQRVLP